MHRILALDLSIAAVLLILVTLLSSWSAVVDASIEHGIWDYESRGPSAWAKLFPHYCSGRKQSPVSLSLAGSVTDSTLTEYSIRETETAEYMLSLSNDGHKLQIVLGPELQIRIGQGERMHYTANQLHWHWGADDTRGSEHTMESRRYPMEGHLVFYNSFDYANFSMAVHRVSGLAVLGVFYEVSKEDNPLLLKLEPYLPRLVNFSSSVNVKIRSSELNFIDAFLPTSRRHFYRYEGSLTTPTCNENVLWTVYRAVASVSARQLDLLRALRYPSGKPMVDNFRPPQPFNSAHRPGANRLLYRNFDWRGRGVDDIGFAASRGSIGGDTSGADRRGASSCSALLSVAAAVLVWHRLTTSRSYCGKKVALLIMCVFRLLNLD